MNYIAHIINTCLILILLLFLFNQQSLFFFPSQILFLQTFLPTLLSF